MRSANRADRRLGVYRLAGFHRPRQLDAGPAEIGDNPAERSRGQCGDKPDDERLEDRWCDRLMLLQVSGVMPARIDFEGTQRVQTALLERNGSAWPMSKCLAFLHVLEGEPGLLDERTLRVDVMRAETLFLGRRFVRLVFGMLPVLVDFQPTSNLGDRHVVLIESIDRQRDDPDIRVSAGVHFSHG